MHLSGLIFGRLLINRDKKRLKKKTTKELRNYSKTKTGRRALHINLRTLRMQKIYLVKIQRQQDFITKEMRLPKWVT